MGNTAWVGMYLAGRDIDLIVSHFDEDDEIAWLVADGPDRWIARPQLEDLSENMVLWHIPSGPLPLTGTDGDGSDQWVTDPFEGWDEPQPWRHRSEPLFNHAGVYHLDITSLDSPFLEQRGQIPLSGIGWIANHYASIGHPAHPATERHWKALRRWITKKVARRPSYIGHPRPWHPYAFPEALQAIEAGASHETFTRAHQLAAMAGLNRHVWSRVSNAQ
jgi:hypothetical protein